MSNLKDGYGFIQCTDRESKIFFHFSELVDSKKEIRTQEEVEFTVVPVRRWNLYIVCLIHTTD